MTTPAGSAGCPADARRILVYGVTGSGKSVLAERLAAVTAIPWHPVDELTWLPGWVSVSVAEQRCRITEICGKSEWILDTAYGSWLDVPLRTAELIVALDYPRWFTLQRLIRRTIARLVHRRPICNGNRESLATLISRDSIILWHFRSFKRKRRRIRRWCRDATGPPVVRLTSRRQRRSVDR